ncbi:tyrosine-type recombinase/integrase [Candidatus Bipolaricaulota bacterium]|nr:tyrosine-type recombinase/integrase [Candidatus Bipolaricaulota bacterium]
MRNSKVASRLRSCAIAPDVCLCLFDQCSQSLWQHLSTHIFTTRAGRAVSRCHVQQMAKRHSRKAGIMKNVHPHPLRHTVAADFLRESRNIRLVQDALGHADKSTTTIYNHVCDEEMAAALRQLRCISSFHPRD